MARKLDSQKKLTLNDKFSYVGYWYLPTKCDQKWAGKVSYSPDSGIELEIIVKEEGVDASEFTVVPRHAEVFYGELADYPGRISLLENRWSYFDPQKRTGLAKYCYRSEYLLGGVFLQSLEDALLSALDVNYSYLREWMDSAGFPFERKSVEGRSAVLYDVYNEIQVFYLPTISAEVSLIEMQRGPSNIYEARLERDNYFHIKPDAERDLSWYLSTLKSLRNLLSFLSGIPMEYKAVSRNLAGGAEFNPMYDPELDVYFPIQNLDVKEMSSAELLFSHKNLWNSTKDVFEAWFGLSEDMRVPFNLCLNVINSQGKYPILDFLALVNSLENYHRLCYEEQGLEEGKYEREDGRPYLRERLKELKENLPGYLTESAGLTEEFLKKVKNSRNYYSHYDAKNKDKAMRDAELDDAISRLIPFISYFLYRKINIPCEVIEEVFELSSHIFGIWQRPWTRKSN